MSRPLALFAALALGACASNSGPQPTGVVNGGISGHAVLVADVQSATPTGSVVIVLSTNGDVCGDAGSNVARAGTASVTLELIDNASGAPATPTEPGPYYVTATGDAVPPTNEALVTAAVLDDSCAATGAGSATGMSGIVTLTAVDLTADNPYMGQFDVTLTTGDRLTGDFQSVACDSLTTGRAAPTCK